MHKIQYIQKEGTEKKFVLLRSQTFYEGISNEERAEEYQFSSDSDPDFFTSPRSQTYGIRPSRGSIPRTLISPPTKNHIDSGVKAIYADGSKTDEGTGSAYCILENYGIIASWQGKLDRSNSVSQAEILAIRIKIWTDSLSSLMAILNPKSHHSIVREIQTRLLSHKHIHLRWLKAHVGYLGNECADQLAKEAITKSHPFLLPKPLSYLKAEIWSAALSIRQDNWDNGETGCSTHDIVPRVSNKPVGWNREEIMFVIGHGPFPSYLLRFSLRTHDNCSCGEKGDPIHYATKCPFTLSWHFQTPTVSLKLQWLKNIFTNNFSRTRLRLLMRFICDENNLIVEDNN
ncbi:hypothetical protein AVEN_101787-1 [Araneus ventricosus]|uniref:RNase H type-1 domain-containing protein n=1 Tax=Araneus ventricosus TaxID=182803 RepID=A0A4Y2D2F2_ARAVE|nr:hypothetical protein AVEN_101787-1 [Araneus ventricosus]